MTVSLTPELEKLIEEKLKTGRYPSATEVIGEGLRLLHERDERRRLETERLRREVAVGVAQAERGEFVDGEEVFAKLERRSQERRTAQQGGGQ